MRASIDRGLLQGPSAAPCRRPFRRAGQAPRQVIRIDSMYLTTRAYMDPPSVAGEQNLHRDRLGERAARCSSFQGAYAPPRMAWLTAASNGAGAAEDPAYVVALDTVDTQTKKPRATPRRMRCRCAAGTYKPASGEHDTICLCRAIRSRRCRDYSRRRGADLCTFRLRRHWRSPKRARCWSTSDRRLSERETEQCRAQSGFRATSSSGGSIRARQIETRMRRVATSL